MGFINAIKGLCPQPCALYAPKLLYIYTVVELYVPDSIGVCVLGRTIREWMRPGDAEIDSEGVLWVSSR